MAYLASVAVHASVRVEAWGLVRSVQANVLPPHNLYGMCRAAHVNLCQFAEKHGKHQLTCARRFWWGSWWRQLTCSRPLHLNTCEDGQSWKGSISEGPSGKKGSPHRPCRAEPGIDALHLPLPQHAVLRLPYVLLELRNLHTSDCSLSLHLRAKRVGAPPLPFLSPLPSCRSLLPCHLPPNLPHNSPPARSLSLAPPARTAGAVPGSRGLPDRPPLCDAQ